MCSMVSIINIDNILLKFAKIVDFKHTGLKKSNWGNGYINLIVGIILQCRHISNYYIVHLNTLKSSQLYHSKAGKK